MPLQVALQKLRLLNTRMAAMPRASDFSLPLSGGKYFPEHSRVQALEHRMVMQVYPFLANGIDDDLCELVTL